MTGTDLVIQQESPVVTLDAATLATIVAGDTDRASVERLPVDLSYFEMLPMGIRVHGTPSLAVWIATMRSRVDEYESTRYQIGDLMAYGEDHYGREEIAQAFDNIYTIGTIDNSTWVCRAVPPEVRRPEIPEFSYYQEIAPVPRDVQEHILDLVEEQGLTTKDVRRLVAEFKREGEIAEDTGAKRRRVALAAALSKLRQAENLAGDAAAILASDIVDCAEAADNARAIAHMIEIGWKEIKKQVEL